MVLFDKKTHQSHKINRAQLNTILKNNETKKWMENQGQKANGPKIEHPWSQSR